MKECTWHLGSQNILWPLSHIFGGQDSLTSKIYAPAINQSLSHYYAALLPRRGPHNASHSVCPSVCLSVRLSVRPVIVTERHVAPPSEWQWHTCTFRHALRAAYRTAISAAQILVYLPYAIVQWNISKAEWYWRGRNATHAADITYKCRRICNSKQMDGKYEHIWLNTELVSSELKNHAGTDYGPKLILTLSNPSVPKT